MKLPASIKLHILVTVIFTLLTISGLILTFLDLSGTYELSGGIVWEGFLIQLTILAFICFIVSTVVTSNILLFYITSRRETGNQREKTETDRSIDSY